MTVPAGADATGRDGRVVVLGSINADLGVRVPAFPLPGETVSGGDLVISPGGKGANQAVAAALTGADVTMVGAVGSDRFAEAALSGLRRSGVDLARVRTVDAATGTALITVDAAGENTIIVSPGANGRVRSEYAEIAAALLGDGATADGELQPGVAAAGETVGRSGPAVLVLQGEIDPRVVDDCVDRVRDRTHIRVLVNAAPVTDLARATLEAADPLVVNESEALLIARQIGASPAASAVTDGAAVDGGDADPAGAAGAGSGESSASHDPREAMAALAAGLVEWGIPAVVLTLGAQGSLVAEREAQSPQEARSPREERSGPAEQTARSDSGQSSARVVVHRIEAIPARTVDTTGAGDMFVGALAAHLASGRTLVEAARAAAVRAAATVEHPGAQSSYFAALDVRTH